MYLTGTAGDPTLSSDLMTGSSFQSKQCNGSLARVGAAVANAQSSIGSLAPPESFTGIVGPSILQEIATAQARLVQSGSFLGKQVVQGTPVSNGPSVQVVPSMNINATLLPVLCPPRFRSRAQGAPMWGDAASTLCSQYPGGWGGFVGSHPWISLILALAGGGALVALSNTSRRR